MERKSLVEWLQDRVIDAPKSALPRSKPQYGKFFDQDTMSDRGVHKCRAGNLAPPFQFVALFFSRVFLVHGKAVHFLNIQKALTASTTFWKNGTVFGRGHPEKWQNLPTVK